MITPEQITIQPPTHIISGGESQKGTHYSRYFAPKTEANPYPGCHTISLLPIPALSLLTENIAATQEICSECLPDDVPIIKKVGHLYQNLLYKLIGDSDFQEVFLNSVRAHEETHLMQEVRFQIYDIVQYLNVCSQNFYGNGYDNDSHEIKNVVHNANKIMTYYELQAYSNQIKTAIKSSQYAPPIAGIILTKAGSVLSGLGNKKTFLDLACMRIMAKEMNYYQESGFAHAFAALSMLMGKADLWKQIETGQISKEELLRHTRASLFELPDRMVEYANLLSSREWLLSCDQMLMEAVQRPI